MTRKVLTLIHIAAWDAGPELEVEAHVNFNVTKARPQSLNEPAEAASVEITKFVLKDTNGKVLECPAWLEAYFADSTGFEVWLLSEAEGQDEYVRDQKADADREEQLLGRVA